jgi:response regulator RpfG family c-di-GMP phosphodiesterase
MNAAIAPRSLPRILCVDDESRVLDGLELHLRREYDVHRATGGEEALQVLKAIGGASVVISDMRMPGMDGATLLQRVMKTYPETVRILLTGQPGRDSAVAAVNQAQIFRFLTKPCSPEQLKAAVSAGMMQHRLVLEERKILKETLIGCIQALMDVLAIVSPVAFGRASRLKRLTVEFAETLECGAFWQLEAAAMLSQLWYLSLPGEVVGKLYYGEPLNVEERQRVQGMPDVVSGLLKHIPRLDAVTQIVTALNWGDEQLAKLGDSPVGLGAKILGLVLAYDELTMQGHSADVAVKSLSKQSGRFGEELLERFGRHVGAGAANNEVREIPLKGVVTGMLIMQDLRTQMGTLLVPRGFEVTTAFIERSRNFGPDLLNEKIKVLVRV